MFSLERKVLNKKVESDRININLDSNVSVKNFLFMKFIKTEIKL